MLCAEFVIIVAQCSARCGVKFPSAGAVLEAKPLGDIFCINVLTTLEDGEGIVPALPLSWEVE